MSINYPGNFLNEFTFVARVVRLRALFRPVALQFSNYSESQGHRRLEPNFYQLLSIDAGPHHRQLILLRAWLVPGGVFLFMRNKASFASFPVFVSSRSAGFQLLRVLLNNLKASEAVSESIFIKAFWRFNVLR